MSGLDWLTARPVAHRGRHDAAAGIIENTPSAFAAAIAGNYAIETDVQVTADGEAMVHHDDELGRLTHGAGRLDALSAADLKRVSFKATSDRMITLGELCDLVAERATLVIELKSHFDDSRRLAARVGEVLGSYRGPAAAMSFDPDIVAALRATAPRLTRGIVAERHYAASDWPELSAMQRRTFPHLLHCLRTRPQFVAYGVTGLPAAGPSFARHVLGLPLLTWTVRTADDRQRAARFADQMVFEGFQP